MLLGLLHTNEKAREEALCVQCKLPIKIGELHALVVLRYGAGQKAIAEARRQSLQIQKRRAVSINPRSGLLYIRVHLKCIGAWVLVRYMARSESRRSRTGGRPVGSTPLSALTKDQALGRRRLIRQRAELLRRVANEEAEDKLDRLYIRFIELNAQIDSSVPMVKSLVRVNRDTRQLVNDKLTAAKRRLGV